MSTLGTAIPGTNVPSAALVSPGGPQGIQGIQGLQGPGASPSFLGFALKSGAYTIVTADRGQYFICSGGSWTLTLPVASVGFFFQVRNDQGLVASGTITLQPPAGTIDGAASLKLLPAQECTVVSDGTNWRTFGLKREVVIGTIDVSATQANVTILLPVGYRVFEIDLTNLGSDTQANGYLQFSNNGGSSWLNTNYYGGVIYNNAATTMAFSDAESQPNLIVAAASAAGTTVKDQVSLTIYPGGPSTWPTFVALSGSRQGAYQQVYAAYGQYNTAGLINAMLFFWGSGNVNSLSATVKGRV